jgi:catechol 2,3-dioxygenase-like lactoylglutathione lyase family enzyme
MLTTTKAFASLSAPDIAEAKKFYSEVLGLEVKDKMEGIEVTIPGGGLPMFIYPAHHPAANYTVLNLIVPDIEEAADALAAKGVTMEQYPSLETDTKGISRTPQGEPGPTAIAWLKDPAGHIISLIQE